MSFILIGQNSSRLGKNFPFEEPSIKLHSFYLSDLMRPEVKCFENLLDGLNVSHNVFLKSFSSLISFI